MFRQGKGTTATAQNTRSLQRRRIIQRPRLLALLDESTARVRALVAAAGYGKTTLAEQWMSSEGRRSAWYTARRSSVDVAALALGVARAASTVVEGCEIRLREHLRAVSAPTGNVRVLAEILCEDLEAWPADAWLVLDDYQELAGASEAESFVAELVAGCPLQLLLASRQRPSWVTARSILYGEVLELNQTALAMDNHEAAEVLVDWSGPSASGLVALANGWPAVIGLASVSSAEIEGDHAVPESLFRFFAEEVFDALGHEVREGLALLAVAPMIDRELAGELLGDDAAEGICTVALDVGILVERGSRLELHPLARSFLEERTVAIPSREAIARCLAHYKNRRDWDAAFDVISRRGAVEDLAPLLIDALDDLLETARLSTIEAWCDFARESGVDGPVFSLARAETALRQGRHAQAQSHAETAATKQDLTFRALSVAGRAAHLAFREEEALELYRRAEEAASTELGRRDALWGQLMCAIELELPEAKATLEQLSYTVGLSDPREALRAAACRLMYQIRLSSLDLAEADFVSELLGVGGDPLIESSFASIYANALALSARYVEAQEIADALLALVQRYRLEFAAPYGLCAAAMSHAGRRRWDDAYTCLDEATRIAREGRNLHAELSCFAIRLRTLAQEGKQEVALALPIPELRSIPAVRAEVLSSRALVLASVGRYQEAGELLDEIRHTTSAIEPAVLATAVVAITNLKLDREKAIESVLVLEDVAFTTGAVDLLVAAYRCTPELLAVLIRSGSNSGRIPELIRRARDEDLARALGQPLGDGYARERLSVREREVYQLLLQGLSNRQISKLLFIEESTVKAHAHHIYEKLGIHSRKSLIVRAALDGQATSATAGTKGDPEADS